MARDGWHVASGTWREVGGWLCVLSGSQPRLDRPHGRDDDDGHDNDDDAPPHQSYLPDTPFGEGGANVAMALVTIDGGPTEGDRRVGERAVGAL